MVEGQPRLDFPFKEVVSTNGRVLFGGFHPTLKGVPPKKGTPTPTASTASEAFPDGGPVPVALQPPAAVPHLVEFHHQRGKLTMDRHCALGHAQRV